MNASDPPCATLLRKLERISRNESVLLTAAEGRDLLRLIHELDVDRFELEARDEQLRRTARELEASRREFAELYASGPVAFVKLSIKGMITKVNAAACNLLPDFGAHLVGAAFSQCVAPPDRGIFFRNMKEIASSNRTGSFEVRLNRGAEAKEWPTVYLQVAPYLDPEGNPGHWNLAFFDVSERKRLENELRRERELLALAVDSGGIGIWSYDEKTRRTYWNDQLYRLLGVEPRKGGMEDGETFFEFIHPEDRQGILQGTRAVIEAGSDRLELEFRIVRGDGRVRWLASRGTVERDESGQVTRLQGVNFDITDKKRYEIEIRESRAQFRSVLENALDAAYRRDLQAGSYDYVSPVFDRILGYPLAEVEEMTAEVLLGLVHPEDRTRATAEMEAALRAGVGRIEYRMRRKDGVYIWVADQFTIQRDDAGRPRHRTGVLRDISGRKCTELELAAQRKTLTTKLAELEQRNEELAEYAYIVSHDLRAPLRAVRNYVDFLTEDLDGRLSGDQQTCLEGLRKATSEGLALIDDLLAFALVGQKPEAPEKIAISELVREVLSLLSLPDKSLVTVRDGCPPVTADRSLLKQILKNLIENGLKFNSSDAPRVEVSGRYTADHRIEIRVSDNGIGIAPRYREQVFRVFQRLHPSSVHGGTGIGLAIVKKAAANLGGSVSLDSTPGQGATFILDLPWKT